MSVHEAMFDADVRVDQVIYLPGLAPCGEGSFPDVLVDEFIFECSDLSPKAPLREQAPEIVQILEAGDSERGTAESLCEWVNMRRVGGFLVQAATPVQRHHGGGSYLSGWGQFYTGWLYCATEADIVPLAVAWAEKNHADDRAKAAA